MRQAVHVLETSDQKYELMNTQILNTDNQIDNDSNPVPQGRLYIVSRLADMMICISIIHWTVLGLVLLPLLFAHGLGLPRYAQSVDIYQTQSISIRLIAVVYT